MAEGRLAAFRPTPPMYPPQPAPWSHRQPGAAVISMEPGASIISMEPQGAGRCREPGACVSWEWRWKPGAAVRHQPPSVGSHRRSTTLFAHRLRRLQQRLLRLSSITPRTLALSCARRALAARRRRLSRLSNCPLLHCRRCRRRLCCPLPSEDVRASPPQARPRQGGAAAACERQKSQAACATKKVHIVNRGAPAPRSDPWWVC